MNLLDIRTKEWNTDLLAAAGEGLAEKLGSPLSPNTVVGHVSEYMQERSVQKLVIGKHNSMHSIQQQQRVDQHFQNQLSCMSVYHEKKRGLIIYAMHHCTSCQRQCIKLI